MYQQHPHKYNKNNSYNHVINELQDYMLTPKLLEYSTSFILKRSSDFLKKNSLKNEKKYQKNNDTGSKKEQPFFIPKQKDSLFWCFYVMKHGDIKYEMMDINVVVEKNLKIDYVTRLRDEKTLLKNYKFGSLINIENFLVNEQKININTFFSLCVIENINVIYIHKKTYYELILNSSLPIYIVHYFNETHNYGLEEFTQEKIDYYRNNLYKIINVEKPIKAISSYKSEELIDICGKLGINIQTETGKNKLKKTLYEEIVQQLS
jgi:hypothetical protein